MAPKSPKDEDDRNKTSHKSAKSAKDHYKKHKDHHKNKHTKTPPDDGIPSTDAILLQMPPEMFQHFPEGDPEYASYRERSSKKDENDAAADKEQDMSSTGRFCILLGALGIMAIVFYFVVHLYQWVVPSEKILIVDNSTTTPLAENTATSAMSRYA